MTPSRVAWMTALAMLAFAANSLLCRLALRGGHIDAASFTTLRLGSGALILWLIVRARGTSGVHGNWPSALALFAYAAGFSFAYLTLPASVGALLLFGSVQATMIGYGLWRGERLRLAQTLGLVLACTGLVILMLPGLAAPPLGGSLLMVVAGMAWGVYSLRGRGVGNATASTAGNFLRGLPLAVAFSAMTLTQANLDAAGVAYALASGAIASGLGYAIWYSALPGLRATSAASIQLSVPVIATLSASALLDEAITLRLIAASLAVLSGIAMVILGRRTA